MSSETLTKLLPALIKAKLAFGPVLKDATNPAFKSKYASLDSVLDAVNPALLANGLIIVQPTVVAEGHKAVLRTLLFHESGEFIDSEWPLNPQQATPQSEGSALTYGKRYAVLSLLGIAPEDDDGNAASRPSSSVGHYDQPTYEDPEKWLGLIDAAGTVDELQKVSEQSRPFAFDDQAMKQLNAAFTARKQELTGALV